MQITLHIKCPVCLSDSLKKNGRKSHGKQNYQCKECQRQFIGDYALTYLGCHSNKENKIRYLIVRDSGIRDIAEVEHISQGKVLLTLEKNYYKLTSKQSQYDRLEVDELWTFVGKKTNKQ